MADRAGPARARRASPTATSSPGSRWREMQLPGGATPSGPPTPRSRRTTARTRSGWRSRTATSSRRSSPTRPGAHLDQFQRIDVDPASVSVVRYTDAAPLRACGSTTPAATWRGLVPPPPRARRGRRRRRSPRRPPSRSTPGDARGGWRRRRAPTRVGTCRSSTSTRRTGSSPARSGPPGQRTFFLQASERRRGSPASSLEKQQVVGPGRPRQRPARRASPAARPPTRSRPRPRTTRPLDTPIEDEFRVGTLSLAWDAERARGRHRVPRRRRAGRGRRGRRPASSSTRTPSDRDDRSGSCISPASPARSPGAARARVRRPPAVPVLRRTAGPDRSHLPALQRLQALTEVLPPVDRGRGRGAARAARPSASSSWRVSSSTPPTSRCCARLRAPTGVEHPGACYKPVRGERPLWDFPDGTLADREVAAYVVSAAAGWDVVPADRAARRAVRAGARCSCGSRAWTARSEDGPVRPRSAGWSTWCPGAVAPGWLPVFEAELHAGEPVVRRPRRPAGPGRGRRPRRRGQQRRPQGLAPAARPARVAVGVRPRGDASTSEPKLRTVLWGWAGEPLPDVELARLDGLAVALDTADQRPGAGPRASCSPAPRSSALRRARGRRCCAPGRLPAARRPAGPPSRGRRSDRRGGRRAPV